LIRLLEGARRLVESHARHERCVEPIVEPRRRDTATRRGLIEDRLLHDARVSLRFTNGQLGIRLDIRN
jgi:hypothetical protein